MTIKSVIGYGIVACVAFAIGVQLSGPVRRYAADISSPPAAEKKPWGGRADKPILDNESGKKQYSETANVGKYTKEMLFRSEYHDADLIVPPGVFMPGEAEAKVLPLMDLNPNLFKDKTVLEIGTGSGSISIYAAKLGATRVISTDIDPVAIDAAKANAERLGVGDIVEPRLVPEDDMSAYSAIKPDESFDIIISNPPYALDLDAPVNTAAVDTGELGFSIVRGFKDHLNPDGTAMLFYDSLFYHQVMKKYARHEGYTVISHNPIGLYTWAAETLFNSYLRRLLEKENLPLDTITFVRDQDGLNWFYLRNQGLDPEWTGYPKLIPESEDNTYFPGWMTIRYPATNTQ